MIKFNELYIDSKAQKLVIDISILDLDYYDANYISGIYIDTQDTYVDGAPSSQAVYTLESFSSDQITDTLDDDTSKPRGLRVVIDTSSIDATVDSDGNTVNSNDLRDNLFFVYVKIGGEVADGTPCPLSKTYSIGVVYYKGIIYRNMMQGVKEIEISCEIPKFFIDSHLRLQALNYAIYTDNFREAIYFYNRFFRGYHESLNSNVVSCNCGR